MTLANTLNYLKVSLFMTTNTMLITFRITFSSFTTGRIVIRSFNNCPFHNHWERFLQSGIVKKYALCFFLSTEISVHLSEGSGFESEGENDLWVPGD